MKTIQVVAILHLIYGLFISIYPFIIQRKTFDYFILILVFLTALGWSICRGECAISVIVNKFINPTYIIGTAKTSPDLDSLFGFKFKLLKLTGAIQFFAIVKLMTRNHESELFSNFFAAIFILCYWFSTLQNSILNFIFACIFIYGIFYVSKKLFDQRLKLQRQKRPFPLSMAKLNI